MTTLREVSELYAKVNGSKCEGDHQCHWCTAPCSNTWTHDEPPPQIGVKLQTIARRVGSPYICSGCWLYRRQSQTVQFYTKQIDEKGKRGLIHPFRDRQQLKDHSWILTEKEFYGLVFPVDGPKLYRYLLKPNPLMFCLSLVEGGIENHISLAVLNTNYILTNETKLYFTYNNAKHHYTIYELAEAIKHGPKGKDPGIGILMRILGDPGGDIFKTDEELAKEEEIKRGRGRPKPLDDAKKVLRKPITRSGQREEAIKV